MKDFEFRLKEYDTAVNDRAEIIREINRIEKGCLIVSGLIFSWLLNQKANSADQLYLISWFIPLVISGLGGLRVLALNSVLENRENYLRKLEENFISDSPEGMFSFYLKTSKGSKKTIGRKTYIGKSSIIYWTSLIILCICIPLFKLAIV